MTTGNQSIIKAWKQAKFNKKFFAITTILVIFGFLIFLSASLGLQAKGTGVMQKLVINQLIFGILGGLIMGYVAYKLPLRWLKNYSVPIFIGALILTGLVLVPDLGLTHGGATRWLNIGPLTFQPAEFLKIATIVAASAWFSFVKKDVKSIKLGLGGLLVITLIPSVILLMQPDTGTTAVIAAAVGSIFLIAGAKKTHIAVIVILGALVLAGLIIPSEYRMNRIKAFIDPSANSLDIGFQTQQSLIATGSGKIFGRGPGQSLQKFSYLPEPVGDSVFAVFAEEFGFLGTFTLVGLYSLLGISGLRIASRIKSKFPKLLVVGLVVMILVQSILNMGAMVGLVPLSGMPLIFVSHGGSALLFSLFAAGLILNASKLEKKRRYQK